MNATDYTQNECHLYGSESCTDCNGISCIRIMSDQDGIACNGEPVPVPDETEQNSQNNHHSGESNYGNLHRIKF